MTSAKPRRTPPRAAPKTTPQKPDESVVDQMAEDATPAEFLPGTPEFRVPLAITPRSNRAEFKRRYADVVECYQKVAQYRSLVETQEEPSMAEQLRIYAELDEVGQAVDNVLSFVAIDPEAYAKWSAEVSDDDLLKTFNIYQKLAQPGEASSSTS